MESLSAKQQQLEKEQRHIEEQKRELRVRYIRIWQPLYARLCYSLCIF